MSDINFSHGGNIYEIKRQYNKDIIDFSANINPLGLPLQVRESICKKFNEALHYPDIQAKEITKKIAEYWHIKEDNILVGNGATELIYLIMHALKPKITTIITPTFSEYEHAAHLTGSKIRFIQLKEEDNFKLKDLRIGKADILFLCNPNNPTGNFILNDYRMVEKIPTKFIVTDEAFMDFSHQEKEHTLIWEAQKSKKMIVLRSLTKFFAMPGLRVGYLIAHKDIVKFIRQCQIPWSVNVFAQKAATVALSDKDYIDKTRVFIKNEKEFISDSIIKIRGLIPYPTVTNFILVKIENKNITSTLLRKKLIQRGILIRDCANFRGLTNKFIRIAIRTRNENRLLITALREIFDEKS